MQRYLHIPLLSLALLTPTGVASAADGIGDRLGSLFEPVDTVQRGGQVYFGSRLRISEFDDTAVGYQVPGAQPDEAISAYDVGIGSALTLGYATGPMMGPVGGRVEAELGMFSSSVSEITVGGVTRSEDDSVGSISGFTGYVSGYADAHLGRFMPFVGGGVGVASLELSDQGSFTDDLIVDDTSTALAAHLSAGIGFAVTQRNTFEIGYRHEFFSDAEFTQ